MIAQLQAQLEAMQKQVDEGQYAIDWVHAQVEEGRVSIGPEGRPNIIGSEVDQSEEQMM